VNTIDGTHVRIAVDGHPLDLRAGELPHHERVLDMRAGTLNRSLRWRSPAGRQVGVWSERLVSFVHRGVAAVRYTVRAVDEPVSIALTSSLVANGQQPHLPSHPSADDLLRHPLDPQEHHVDGGRIMLLHRTHRSGLCVAAGADHRLESPAELAVHLDSNDDWARLTATAELGPGEEITLVKLVGYAWSADRSLTAVRDEVSATLTAARHTGWRGLLDGQRAYLDAFWADADVEIEGDDELQQAIRFALWHLLQATARAEGRAIAGKGLTGTGYEGHALWDTETFVLQVLTALRPEVTRQALGWRHSTLEKARARAREIDLRGAAFPWRTIAGEECSGYWPAGAAALHVNADIADAVIRYVGATGDLEFARTTGLDLLVETARLWASFGLHGRDGRFHLHGVTGPDEYSALADDNVYTNLMAQQNLLCAARWSRQHPDDADRHGVDPAECDGWEAAARAMALPYDEDLGVHPQAAGFTDLPRWDFANTPAEHYPLQEHFPYLQLYRKQVVKQADLVPAMHLRGDAFTDEQKARNVAYYEGVTVRDSSLSASSQAVLAAEVGHLDLAYDYLAESALSDLRDATQDSADGLHLAALAGSWVALEVGDTLTVRHEGEYIELSGHHAVARKLAPRPRPPAPEQPANRAPIRRDIAPDQPSAPVVRSLSGCWRTMDP
jgi:alpha,alpha-trehalose phosphorylase